MIRDIKMLLASVLAPLVPRRLVCMAMVYYAIKYDVDHDESIDIFLNKVAPNDY